MPQVELSRQVSPQQGWPKKPHGCGAQVPPVQVPEHEFPQPPQLLESEDRSTQVFPQSVVPAGHAQVPPVQTPFVGHAVPQAPQWSGSLSRLAHVLVSPVVQINGAVPGQAQDPSLQTAPLTGQALPHAPQSVGAEATSTQAGEPAQFVTVLGVPSQEQTPFEQTPSPHSCPHWPQLFASVDRSTHRPLQSTWPAGHAQVPSVQLAP
jgi:hypothetical protein